jgi:hypothetical protein
MRKGTNPEGGCAMVGCDKPDQGGGAAKNSAPTDETRAARFNRLYPGKTKLTFGEYLAKQSDQAAAKERFQKFDADQDGFVSREEFITSDGRNPNAK